ncbi:MAG: LOG family protein, partial [Lactobacillus sp.]|nr:LOG family protein [Lactobacillus sp.]
MTKKCTTDIIETFNEQNQEEGVRVFVAGGNRAGKNPLYVEEAYNLGKQIVKVGFKLSFGVGNAGIMGAVARGVMDTWNKKTCGGSPITGITTKEYLSLYPTDDKLIKSISNLRVADTLEDRKKQLLEADIIVFAPGGVGTLDELAYDMVAMQDGFIPKKPFVMYNVNGYFYHLLEYLKDMSSEGFADPVPFIVVDNYEELVIAFRLLKHRYKKAKTNKEVYANTRQLIYELPYFVKKKTGKDIFVEHIVDEINEINSKGTAEERQTLAEEIEQAYLEKEIERMHERLVIAGRNTG